MNIYKEVTSYINTVPVGATFTTNEFHAHMAGLGYRDSYQPHYRINTYRTYLRSAGFVTNVKRGLWRVVYHIPESVSLRMLETAKGYKCSRTAMLGAQKQIKELQVSEQFIKSYTKTKKTVMPKTHSVTSKFIIAGHKEACAPWQKELEAKFPQVFPVKTESKISVKVGGIYQLPTHSGRTRYILATIGTLQVVLISLANGNRWCDSITVADAGKFTLEDVKKIFDGLDLKQVTGDDGGAIIVPAITPKIPVSVEVDEEFIMKAHGAAPSDLAKKIKENFPQVFNNSPYAKLIDEEVSGSTLSLSTSGTRLDHGVSIGIADGFAPSEDKRKRSIYVHGDGVEDVTVEKYNGRWIISIKKKS